MVRFDCKVKVHSTRVDLLLPIDKPMVKNKNKCLVIKQMSNATYLR